MISLLDNKEIISSFDGTDVFAARVISDRLSGTSELIWWDEKKLLIGLKNGVMSISGTISDPEELKAFIGVISPQVVMCQQDTAELLKLRLIQSGVLMSKKSGGASKPLEGYYPDVLFSDYYELLEKCRMAPDYAGFCRETSVALRSGTGLLLDEWGEEKLTAALISASVTSSSAIINAVAVEPEHRRKGLGRKLLRKAEMLLSGRTLYIMREDDKNKEFYTSCGYCNAGRWCVADNK